jgi:small subunit ribosomal protein S20
MKLFNAVCAFALAASAAAYSPVAPRTLAVSAIRSSAVVMSDAPAKKYRPTSFGVNPRVFKDRKNNVYNRYYKSTQATALKKVTAAMTAGDKAEATKLFSLATSVIDKNVKRGIIHKNKGARNKSRWQKRLDSMGK